MFSFRLPLVLLCLLILTTGSRDPLDVSWPEPPSEGLLRCPIPPGWSHCVVGDPNLPFRSFPSLLGQTSLSRVMQLLSLRFYGRLIPLFCVRYTSPSGGRLLAELGGGVSSAFSEDCTSYSLDITIVRILYVTLIVVQIFFLGSFSFFSDISIA